MKTFGQIYEAILNELSGKTLVGYIHKATNHSDKIRKISYHHLHKMTSLRLRDPKLEKPEHKKEYEHVHKDTRRIMRRLNNHDKGTKQAYKKLETR